MSEKLNFKQKLRKVKALIFDVDGVFTDGTVMLTADGDLMRTMNTKDGFIIKHAICKGYKVAIISGGKSGVVRKRFLDLGVKDVYLGVKDTKIDTFDKFMENQDFSKEEVLYMGDDIPDLEILKCVGTSASPSDAIPQVKNIVDYVSHLPGGKGCVRDVIEKVMRLHGKW
mgnify:CR=1 FL=1